MRAFVVRGPGEAGVEEVEPPVAQPGEVVVEVARVGLCGTDAEFFTGEMPYLHDGNAAYPMRLGHEWSGTVSAIGDGVEPAWIGRRVTGDTMHGCGLCARCRTGRHHVCATRTELGIRGGRHGALGEQVAIPAASLHVLPEGVDDAAGALVEPGGNAYRSVVGADLHPGERVLILGPGTIGLLCAMFARAAGAHPHLLGIPGSSLEFARTLGFDGVWTEDDLPELSWHAVIDASNAAALPARAVELVEPARRVVYVGLAGRPSLLDTRLVALKDLTAVGILGGSAGLDPAIEAFAREEVDPRPLIAATVTLDEVAAVLAGWRPCGAGAGPKIQVDVTAAVPVSRTESTS